MTPPSLEELALRELEAHADPRDVELAESYLPKNEREFTPLRAGDGPDAAPVKQGSATGATLFRFIPACEYLTPPDPPNWAIDGIAEVDSLCQLFGDPEAGKSFMAIDWACCVATGKAWKGREVQQGPVLYINGEGRNGFNRRLNAWQIANQVKLGEAPLHISSTSTALTDAISKAELEAVLAEFIREQGHPRMIVIDTLARNFGPGDENETQHMSAAVNTLDALREMTQAWTLVVHHSGHGDKGRARGSIVMRGSVDTEYRMGRITPDGDTMLTSSKIKDGSQIAPMSFRFADVELGIQDRHGNEVKSAVLLQTAAPAAEPGLPPDRKGKGKNQNAALALLIGMYARRQQNLASGGCDPEGASVAMTEWREACREAGLEHKRISEALNSLIDGGKVIQKGPYVYLTSIPE